MKKDLGALWIKRGGKGEYMTGTIEIGGEKLNIVCFLNDNKKEQKHPDWRILRSVPKEQRINPLPMRDDEVLEELNPEDVPF
jgi:hypothetical protein